MVCSCVASVVTQDTQWVCMAYVLAPATVGGVHVLFFCCCQFLPRDAMQARPQPLCGVCVSVCPSRSWTVSHHSSFSTQTAWQYSTGTPIMGALNAGGVGRNRDSQPISGFIACCERCDGQLLSTRLSAVLGYHRCLLELVISTDVRPSSGVSQWPFTSVYGTESHTPVNNEYAKEKRREHNLIYAAVKLSWV